MIESDTRDLSAALESCAGSGAELVRYGIFSGK